MRDADASYEVAAQAVEQAVASVLRLRCASADARSTPRAVALLVAGALTAVVAYWTLPQVLCSTAVLMLAVPVIGLVTLIPAIRSKGASITVPNDLREGHGGWVEVQAPEAFTDAQYRWKSLASGFTKSPGCVLTEDPGH